MRGYETARALLERERCAVEALARELLEHESVDGVRAAQILAGSAASQVPPWQPSPALRLA
jgi:hypothetical protein